jgi:serine/threonine-protein kinase
VLLERLAVGGMAEVFRAVEANTTGAGAPRTLVIKRMLPALTSDTDARAMFAEERRIGAFVHHENVVAQVGGGEADGTPYLALELVPGMDLWKLTRWLTREGRAFDVPLAVFVACEVLAGLAAVHAAQDENGNALGVVHRDVSPSNVLLSLHGEVKIADLGIASTRTASPRADGLIAPGAPTRAKGKLGYLAPEQVRGEPIDQRADVFGVGVILAELLLGRPLFSGGSELAVLLAIRDGDVRAFREIASQLPAGLAPIVLAALARDREKRIASATALRHALARFAPTETSVLRAELAELVRTGVATLDGDDAAPRTPQTPLVPVLGEDGRTPVASPELPTTGEMPTLDYVVQTATGERHGPWPFARMVHAIATGGIGPDDLVSAGGGAFRAVGQISGLARHFPLSSMSAVTRERDAPAEPDAVFRLEEGGFVQALSLLVLREETGLLLCEQGGVRKEVYVLRGAPTFVTSNLASELLGEFLVARGVISRGELDMALAVLPRFEGRLGDTLAALGLVEPVHLFQHIASQVREKLLDLFSWSGGRASLWRGAQAPQSGFPLGLDPWSIIEEGIARRIAQGLDDDFMQASQNLRLCQARPAPKDVDASKLPTGARRLCEGLSIPRLLRTLVATPGNPSCDDKVAAIMLVRLGLARLA